MILRTTRTSQSLRALGIPIYTGPHKAKHIENASVVVISSAIKSYNLEIVAAHKKGIPVIRRAEMLAELMRP